MAGAAARMPVPSRDFFRNSLRFIVQSVDCFKDGKKLQLCALTEVNGMHIPKRKN
jgi:hypothetical protein